MSEKEKKDGTSFMTNMVELFKLPLLIVVAVIALSLADKYGIIDRFEEINATGIKFRQAAAEIDNEAIIEQLANERSDFNRGPSWYSRRDLCPTADDEPAFWIDFNQQAEQASSCAILKSHKILQKCNNDCPSDFAQCRIIQRSYYEALRACENAQDDCGKTGVTTKTCQRAKEACNEAARICERPNQCCEKVIAGDRTLRRYSTLDHHLTNKACLKPNSVDGYIWIGNFYKQFSDHQQPTWIAAQLKTLNTNEKSNNNNTEIILSPDSLNIDIEYTVANNLIAYNSTDNPTHNTDEDFRYSRQTRRQPIGIIPSGAHVKLLEKPQLLKDGQCWALIQVRGPNVCGE